MSDKYGLKISLPGFDVNDQTQDLVLSSEYRNPMVKLGVTPAHFDYENYTIVTNPGLGTTNLVSIAHGYTYVPANLSLFSFDQTTFFVASKVLTDFVNYEDRYQIYCDDTNFKIDLERVTLGGASPDLSGTVVYYKYYIFADDGL